MGEVLSENEINNMLASIERAEKNPPPEPPPIPGTARLIRDGSQKKSYINTKPIRYYLVATDNGCQYWMSLTCSNAILTTDGILESLCAIAKECACQSKKQAAEYLKAAKGTTVDRAKHLAKLMLCKPQLFAQYGLKRVDIDLPFCISYSDVEEDLDGLPFDTEGIACTQKNGSREDSMDDGNRD